MRSDNCSVAHQVAEEGGGVGCDIAKQTREVLHSGDDFPRLWTGEEARTEPNIEVGSINAPPRRRGSPSGYDGVVASDETGGKPAVNPAPREAKASTVKPANPDEKISFNFERAPMEFFLKQMLGGALGANYIAPDDLEGSVTFKTEQPIPKAQALQIVKDIVARNGLRMRLLNGVYHIDQAGSERAGSSEGNSEETIRTIEVSRGNAVEVANIVRALVPQSVSIVPSKAGDAIVVRGSTNEIDEVAELVSAFTANGRGEDRIAIVPLQQAAPDSIAVRLTDFYRQRLAASGGEAPTILPLENQQAILIGTRDPHLMAGVKRLARELDRNGDIDEPTVRLIPLVHLDAEVITDKLRQIFATGGSSTTPSGSATPQGSFQQASAGKGSQNGGGASTAAFDGEDTGASGSDNSFGSNGPRSAQRSPAPGSDGPMSEAGVGAGGAVRLVPDTRNNAIMVYSNYALFKRIRDVVRTMDVPQAEVVIEATIAEVVLTDDLQFGVQAFLEGNGISVRSSPSRIVQPTDEGRAGLFANIGGSAGPFQVNAVLHALQDVTKVKVISSPYVTVLDGKTARLQIGEQIPFSQTTQQSTSANPSGGLVVTNQIQVKDTGIILQVTPHINANNGVVLTIEQIVSTPSQSVNVGNLTPIIATRQVKSDVLTQSGRTILLAGLIQERKDDVETGVPLVRNIPAVGDLFKTQGNKEQRTELLVMITPRVVRQSPQMEQITRLLRDQTHSQ